MSGSAGYSDEKNWSRVCFFSRYSCRRSILPFPLLLLSFDFMRSDIRRKKITAFVEHLDKLNHGFLSFHVSQGGPLSSAHKAGQMSYNTSYNKGNFANLSDWLLHRWTLKWQNNLKLTIMTKLTTTINLYYIRYIIGTMQCNLTVNKTHKSKYILGIAMKQPNITEITNTWKHMEQRDVHVYFLNNRKWS